jgi:hypothetical protein
VSAVLTLYLGIPKSLSLERVSWIAASPFSLCGYDRGRNLPRLFIYRRSLTVRSANGVQVYLRCAPVLVPENFLDNAHGNVGGIHNRRARMPQWMKAEISDRSYYPEYACLASVTAFTTFFGDSPEATLRIFPRAASSILFSAPFVMPAI